MKWDELQKDHYYLIRGIQTIIIFHFNGSIEDAPGRSGPVKHIGCHSLMHVGPKFKSYGGNTNILAFPDKEFKEITEDDFLKLMKLIKMFESAVFPLIKHLVKN